MTSIGDQITERRLSLTSTAVQHDPLNAMEIFELRQIELALIGRSIELEKLPPKVLTDMLPTCIDLLARIIAINVEYEATK